MTDEPSREELKHDLGNEKQRTRALKNLLDRAADELDGLADADCDEDAKDRAAQVAQRIRRATEEDGDPDEPSGS